MKRLATKMIFKVEKELTEKTDKFNNKLDAWNDCRVDLIFAAKVNFTENSKKNPKNYYSYFVFNILILRFFYYVIFYFWNFSSF